MKRLFFSAIVFLLVLSPAIGMAQSRNDSHPKRYFEVGGEYGRCLTDDWGGLAGGYFIFGKQRNAKFSQGWGIGFDYYRNKDGDMTVTSGPSMEELTTKTYKDYRCNVPVFADFRFNLSHSSNPFYLGLRAGVTFGFSDGDLQDGGTVAGVGIGKSFDSGKVQLSPYLRADVGTIVAGGIAGWIEPLISLGISIRF